MRTRASQLIGEYLLLERLGAGGMAEDWTATKDGGRTIVAMKLLAEGAGDELVGRFGHEARLLEALPSSRFFPRFIEAETDGPGQHYIVMECVEGTDLFDLRDKLNARQKLEIGRLLLEAAAELARRGV